MTRYQQLILSSAVSDIESAMDRIANLNNGFTADKFAEGECKTATVALCALHEKLSLKLVEHFASQAKEAA